MEIELSDLLRNVLIGNKIKLYKVLDKTHNIKGTEYFITQKDILLPNKKIEIIGETIGVIKSLITEDGGYDGDFYNFEITDLEGNTIHYNGLNSITSKLEIIK
jgi:hypothetical protein